ncbi:MAG TPA: regulatory protein RecX [Thermoanaerobaculia bacterium]|jgi:regulatory protein|nr:regulatory protein RecX [Thermoanaerobaculia bacterium]
MTDLDDCYLAAIRILNYRFNSEAELRRKLRSKRFDNADVATTLTRLRNEGWLNDERFAGSYIRTRQRKRIGVRRIEYELHAAGVDDQIVRQAIAENSDEDRERDDLAAACNKRRRLLIRRHGAAYLETTEGRKKLMVYLLNQGYDAALVRSAVKETPVVDD